MFERLAEKNEFKISMGKSEILEFIFNNEVEGHGSD